MGNMLRVLGGLIIAFGLGVGLYISFVWGFIGGIIQVIEAAKADPVVSTDVAWGIGRIFFCNALGVISGGLVALVGLGTIALGEK